MKQINYKVNKELTLDDLLWMAIYRSLFLQIDDMMQFEPWYQLRGQLYDRIESQLNNRVYNLVSAQLGFQELN